MEHFEKLALDSARPQTSLWLLYVEDTFVVWLHGPERLQNLFNNLNNLKPSIQFTVEIETVRFLFWMFWSSGKRRH
jgi:hypothetical protein